MNADDQDSIGTDGKPLRERKPPPKGKIDYEDFDDDDQAEGLDQNDPELLANQRRSARSKKKNDEEDKFEGDDYFGDD